MQTSNSSSGRRPHRALAATLFAAAASLAAAAFPLLAAAAAPPADPQAWRGEFVYFADSASFTDCASGRRWPVAAEGDFLLLQRVYLKWRSAPEAPLLVSFTGRVQPRPSMEGPPRPQMVVDRFESAQPGLRCANLAPAAPAMPAAR